MSQTKAQLISDLVQALNFTGTASSPANGVFLSATNTLAFATNSGSRITIDSSGNLNIPNDSGKLRFGTGNDLKIYHNGQHSFIQHTQGSGNFFIDSAANLALRTATNETSINCGSNGAVELYHDGSLKANTRSDGFEIKQHLTMGDSDEIRLGNSSDLKIYHDGNHSFVENTTGFLILQDTSSIRLRSDDLRFESAGGSESYATLTKDGAVALNFDNSQKFATTSSGATVTGSLGIGTASPLKKLHLADSGDVALMLQTTNAVNDKEIFEIGCGGNASNHADLVFRTRVNAGTGGSEVFRLTNDGNVQITNDTGKLQVGASQDLEIYHDGTNSYIDSSTNDLFIRSNGDDLILRSSDDIFLQPAGGGENGITVVGHGGVELFFDNIKRFETTGTGVEITGDLRFDSSVSGGTIRLQDGQKLFIGGGNDLQIFHDGSASFISDVGTGDLNITGNSVLIKTHLNEAAVFAYDNQQVELYFDNSKKFETTSYGNASAGQVRVTSSNASTVAFSVGDVGTGFYNTGSNNIGYAANGTQKWNISSIGNLKLLDSVQLQLGSSSDLKIYHDGSNSFIDDDNNGSNLHIRGQANIILGFNSEKMAVFAPNGSVELYFDNSKKLETISTGLQTAEVVKMLHSVNGVNIKQVFEQGVGNTATCTAQVPECVGGGTVTVTVMHNGNNSITTTKMFPIMIQGAGTANLGSEIFSINANSAASMSVSAATRGVTVTNNAGAHAKVRVTFDITANA